MNFIERMKLPFKKEKELYSSFYDILGFYPRNIHLYKQALLHKSSSVKSKQGQWMNNERLEFLGDAILDAIVGDIVFHRFEGKKEGFLTNARSKIVQRETLNRIAVEIGLHKLIKYSIHTHNSHNNNVCGNAFEALIGAIYLDRGYNYCMYFMKKRILDRFISVDSMAYKEVNFKSKLIEWTQKNKIDISFNLIAQDAESDGTPVFQTQILLADIPCGTGKGFSKKESQQAAAKETMEMLKKTGFTHKILESRKDNTADTAQQNPKTQENLPVNVKEHQEMQTGLNDTMKQDTSTPLKPQKERQKLSKEEIVEAAEKAAFEI